MTCCAKPSIHTARYKSPVFVFDGGVQVEKINRVCINCYTHWFGTVGEEKQYTRTEWDELMLEAMKT